MDPDWRETRLKYRVTDKVMQVMLWVKEWRWNWHLVNDETWRFVQISHELVQQVRSGVYSSSAWSVSDHTSSLLSFLLGPVIIIVITIVTIAFISSTRGVASQVSEQFDKKIILMLLMLEIIISVVVIIVKIVCKTNRVRLASERISRSKTSVRISSPSVSAANSCLNIFFSLLSMFYPAE